MRLDQLRRSLLARTLNLLRTRDADLKVSRIVDRLAYELASVAPDDPDLVPEFVGYLSAKHRFVEAVQVSRAFVEHDGDRHLLPDIAAPEGWAPTSDALVASKPRSSWTSRSFADAGAYRAEVAAVGDTLDLALDGVGQAVVLTSADEAARTCVAEEIINEAEDRGALICDIVASDVPFLHSCAFALERLCRSITMPAGTQRLEQAVRDVYSICDRLRPSPSLRETGGLAGRLLRVVSEIAQFANLVISIDGGERLDAEGTGFLSQLLLVAKWHRLFVILRASRAACRGSSVEPLLDSIAGSVQFLEVDELGQSA
jgi:hypothetical protein